MAATDLNDRLASFSSYGRKSVHLAAPGVKIFSTYKDGGYLALSGTSMAAPFAAGAAALLWSGHPEWSFKEIKRRLIATSDPMQGLRLRVAAKGRLNVYKAYHDIETPSPEPDEKQWQTIAQTYESSHPYANRENLSVNVSVPGAKFLRVHFDRLETESEFDKLWIETPQGEVLEQLSGTVGDHVSEYVEGDNLVIHLKSDYSNARYGFHVNEVQAIR